VKRVILLLTLLAIAAAFAGSASASRAVPCRNRIYDDWYHDGQIASTYPIACYRDALKHIPPDAKIYSSLDTDIKAAMQAALQRLRGKAHVPDQIGNGLDTTAHGGTKGATVTLHPSRELADKLSREVAAPSTRGPIAPFADTAANTPLPVLVLGGIALALVAAGAVGTGVRYARRRSR
jgi:hypothetical protein